MKLKKVLQAVPANLQAVPAKLLDAQYATIGLGLSLLAWSGASHADIDAKTATKNLKDLGVSVIDVVQVGLVVAGMTSIGYGLLKWRKKGTDSGGDQVEARQILMPVAAGALMICIWAVVEFVVTAGGGNKGDIGKKGTFTF